LVVNIYTFLCFSIKIRKVDVDRENFHRLRETRWWNRFPAWFGKIKNRKRHVNWRSRTLTVDGRSRLVNGRSWTLTVDRNRRES